MIEVLKQALEALEQVTKELLAVRDELAERGARPTTNVFHQRLWDSSFSAYTDHAIPAAQSLRKAIAELESQEPFCYAYKENDEDFFAPKDGYYPADAKPLYTHPPQHIEQNFCPRCGKRTKDIHTCTPPQRTWIGLDHHDKKKFSSWLDHKTDDEVFTAIEAKLKEKSNA